MADSNGGVMTSPLSEQQRMYLIKCNVNKNDIIFRRAYSFFLLTHLIFSCCWGIEKSSINHIYTLGTHYW